MNCENHLRQLLLDKISNREIVAGVIGLGYVGLPLAVESAKAGFRTIGFDLQQEKVNLVNAGKNYVSDVCDEDLSEVVTKGMLSATSDFSLVRDVDFIAICVPTPLDVHQQPDIGFVRTAAESIAPYLHPNMVVVLESTTYPGTTEELVCPILETSGLQCGKDFYLGFSPERVDPGNKVYKTRNTPKVVGAIGNDAQDVIVAMYEAVLQCKMFRVSSPRTAEMTKLLENTYRNINVGLINELTMLCQRMGIDIWEVIEAAKTKPFGFVPFYPGPGLGGHCIPLDPCYLAWKAREYGFHTTMIDSSIIVNDRMPEYCVRRATEILNHCQKPINGSQVLVMGVAYKRDIDDCRESPALKIIDGLRKEGAKVKYYDPYVKKYHRGDEWFCSEPALTEGLLHDSDLVIVTTAHTVIDYAFVQRHAQMIFDTRNAMKDITTRDNIERL